MGACFRSDSASTHEAPITTTIMCQAHRKKKQGNPHTLTVKPITLKPPKPYSKLHKVGNRIKAK